MSTAQWSEAVSPSCASSVEKADEAAKSESILRSRSASPSLGRTPPRIPAYPGINALRPSRSAR
eukprot:6454560-Prymnesium_polylepis.1